MTDPTTPEDTRHRTLLELGRVHGNRPGDLIRSQLARHGDAWIRHALADTLDRVTSMSSEDARRLHARAKSEFTSAQDADARATAILWYHTAIAVAGANDGTLLSSQPVGIVVDALFDLAPDLPDPLGDLFARAAMNLS